jgi:hypothetical protein
LFFLEFVGANAARAPRARSCGQQRQRASQPHVCAASGARGVGWGGGC